MGEWLFGCGTIRRRWRFRLPYRRSMRKAAPVLPAFWSENYISLLPGESQIVTVRSSEHSGVRISAIALTGWNISAQHIPVGSGTGSHGRGQEAALLPLRASASASQPRRIDSAGTLER